MSIEHLDDMHGLDCARHLIKTSSLQGLPFILFYCFFLPFIFKQSSITLFQK